MERKKIKRSESKVKKWSELKCKKKERGKVKKVQKWWKVIINQVVILKKVSLSICYPFLCEPKTKAFIISQLKVLFDQLKLFVRTTLGLIPFRYIGNLVRCCHITSCKLCNSCIEILNQQDFLRISYSTCSLHPICLFLVKVKEPTRLKTCKGNLGKS